MPMSASRSSVSLAPCVTSLFTWSVCPAAFAAMRSPMTLGGGSGPR